jgi:hypothetical protein
MEQARAATDPVVPKGQEEWRKKKRPPSLLTPSGEPKRNIKHLRAISFPPENPSHRRRLIMPKLPNSYVDPTSTATTSAPDAGGGGGESDHDQPLPSPGSTASSFSSNSEAPYHPEWLRRRSSTNTTTNNDDDDDDDDDDGQIAGFAVETTTTTTTTTATTTTMPSPLPSSATADTPTYTPVFFQPTTPSLSTATPLLLVDASATVVTNLDGMPALHGMMDPGGWHALLWSDLSAGSIWEEEEEEDFGMCPVCGRGVDGCNCLDLSGCY